jgi:hypothetical protein
MKPQHHLNRKVIIYICLAAVLLASGAVAVYTAASKEESQPPPAPVIKVTRIPPPGGGSEQMKPIAGEVSGIDLKDCRCKVVIFSLGDVWYVQPYASAPFTEIAQDGRFEANIHLGSKYAVLLVKQSYQPPAKTENLPSVSGDVLALTTVNAVEEKRADSYEDKQSNFARVISFSGYEWKVKTSENQVGPGPNYFSDGSENVEVDAAGRLHLRITQRDGRWQCAEVVLTQSLGYGTYRFYLDTEPEKVGRTVYGVLGMFTWSEASDEFHHREIDCEVSAWGTRPEAAEGRNQLGQFVIQPSTVPHNIARYSMPPQMAASTHAFTWRPESVFCHSLQGHAARPASKQQLIYEHTFTRNVPPAAEGTHARINLWLLAGRPPADGKEFEVIISKFEHAPLP